MEIDERLSDAASAPLAFSLLRRTEPTEVDAARRAFARRKIVALGSLFSSAALTAARGEADDLLLRAGRRRDLRIAATGDSPRRYVNVSRDAIVGRDGVLAALYRDPALREIVARIAGEPRVFTVPYAPEEIVLARMERAGDSHGWHWDDYAFSLVWILDAPDPEAGGAVEYVCETAWDKRDPRIDAYVARGAERMRPAGGDAYLVDGTAVLHRVAPLVRDARRTIACFSYARESDLARPITHETLEALYAGGSEA